MLLKIFQFWLYKGWSTKSCFKTFNCFIFQNNLNYCFQTIFLLMKTIFAHENYFCVENNFCSFFEKKTLFYCWNRFYIFYDHSHQICPFYGIYQKIMSFLGFHVLKRHSFSIFMITREKKNQIDKTKAKSLPRWIQSTWNPTLIYRQINQATTIAAP